MFATCSHELRTPIGIMQNSLSLLKPQIDDSMLKYYDICSIQTSFLLSLVNGILDIAQMKAGKFEPIIETTDIRDLVHEIVTCMELTLQYDPDKQNVFLILNIAEDVP